MFFVLFRTHLLQPRCSAMKTRELISYILNVLFFVAAVYMWYHPHRDRSLSLLSSETSKIYDSQSHTSKLHVTDENNRPITTDVFVTTATVWNDGSEAIETTDIRRPLCLRFDGAERILDSGIIRSNDKGAGAFEIKEARCLNSETPAVEISWKHFDPGYAAKFQVIYSAKSLSAVTSDADLMGIKSVPWRTPETLKSFKITLLVSFLIVAAMAVIAVAFMTTGFNGRHPFLSAGLMAIVPPLVLMLVYFALGRFSTPPL